MPPFSEGLTSGTICRTPPPVSAHKRRCLLSRADPPASAHEQWCEVAATGACRLWTTWLWTAWLLAPAPVQSKTHPMCRRWFSSRPRQRCRWRMAPRWTAIHTRSARCCSSRRRATLSKATPTTIGGAVLCLAAQRRHAAQCALRPQEHARGASYVLLLTSDF